MSHIASLLVSAEDVALAVNAVSVVCSALTVTLTHLIIVALVWRWHEGDPETEDWTQTLTVLGGGTVGALTLAVTDSFWFNAVEAEVYAFATFLMALVCWLALRWSDQVDEEALPASGRMGSPLRSPLPRADCLPLWTGDRCTPPQSPRLFLCGRRRVRDRRRTRAVDGSPALTATDPPIDIGNPETTEALVSYLNRAQYRSTSNTDASTSGTTPTGRFSGGIRWATCTPGISCGNSPAKQATRTAPLPERVCPRWTHLWSESTPPCAPPQHLLPPSPPARVLWGPLSLLPRRATGPRGAGVVPRDRAWNRILFKPDAHAAAPEGLLLRGKFLRAQLVGRDRGSGSL